MEKLQYIFYYTGNLKESQCLPSLERQVPGITVQRSPTDCGASLCVI